MLSPHNVASQLVDRKIDVCFAHADQNGDGVMDQSDVIALGARIIVYIGESFTSPKAQTVLEAFENFAKYMISVMDTNMDNQVSPLEWRDGMKRAFANGSDYDDHLRPIGVALWNLADKDGDGRVNVNEFAAFQRAMGTSPGNSRIAFEKMDRNNDGSLSVEEMLQAHREFYTSPDPDAPGNWLYGDVWAHNFWDGTKAKL